MPVAVRRVIIVLLLLVAGSAVFGLTRLSSEPSQPLDSIIESRQPNDGEKILQQSQITIDLLSGWDGKLTIDGIPIPDDQLIKVREQGIIRFQPAKGKALEYFPAGQNCITFTYWQLATGPEQSFTAKPWCFTSV
jgi:hypothetical protein